MRYHRKNNCIRTNFHSSVLLIPRDDLTRTSCRAVAFTRRLPARVEGLLLSRDAYPHELKGCCFHETLTRTSCRAVAFTRRLLVRMEEAVASTTRSHPYEWVLQHGLTRTRTKGRRCDIRQTLVHVQAEMILTPARYCNLSYSGTRL